MTERKFTKEQIDDIHDKIFRCHKCGKHIECNESFIVDQLNGLLHEECQGEYKGL